MTLEQQKRLLIKRLRNDVSNVDDSFVWDKGNKSESLANVVITCMEIAKDQNIDLKMEINKLKK